jgi:hypothetical protein
MKKIKEQCLLSREGLFRNSAGSPLTLGRVENGTDCRLESKRINVFVVGQAISGTDKSLPEEDRHLFV